MAGIKESLTEFGARQAMRYALRDPEHNLLTLLDWVDRFDGENKWEAQRTLFRSILSDKDNNWYQLIMKLLTQVDSGVIEAFFMNFFLNSAMVGTKKQKEFRAKYDCNIPWAILLDPTSACNLHCTGCWAADYGHNLNLSYEEIDDIINQGTEMGTYMYIYTGGEPLVRKKDIIRLCEAHKDCIFLSFTNATLIDDAFADEMLRVKNFVPAISVEGSEETTDSRRGQGTYQRIMDAMDILREHRLPFGVSCCTTSVNVDAVCSEKFFDKLVEMGSYFAWFFTYMPIGKDAPVELMNTPEQREFMFHQIRALRKTKPLFTMDFWNDGEFVYGCVAGGRYYLHINANGDIEPCVFAHYSDSNIREKTLIEAYTSPLFMQYHENQPFSGNLLRPCPMLDNAGKLAEMVAKTDAKSTDLSGAESAEELCAKCAPTAEAWKKTADRLWATENGRDLHKGSGFKDTILHENQLQVRADYNTEVPETATGVSVDHGEFERKVVARAGK